MASVDKEDQNSSSLSSEVESEGCAAVESDEEDVILVSSQYMPYVDEPVAANVHVDTCGHEQKVVEVNAELPEIGDLDGLTPSTLADREDGVIHLDNW